MTDFNFDCPDCGQNLEAPSDMAGMEVTCPSCLAQLWVPNYDPHARLHAEEPEGLQPILEPPQHPARLKLKHAEEGEVRHDLRKHKSPRTLPQSVYAGGGTRYSGRRADSRPPKSNLVTWAMIVVVLLAGILLAYKSGEKREARKRAAALRERAMQTRFAKVEEVSQAEGELREEIARQKEEERLAREQMEIDQEYAARDLFLKPSPWSSRSGRVIEAKLAGYGDSWVVFKTVTGEMLAVEQDDLSPTDIKRLEKVESVLRVRDRKWDDRAREIVAAREEPAGTR